MSANQRTNGRTLRWFSTDKAVSPGSYRPTASLLDACDREVRGVAVPLKLAGLLLSVLHKALDGLLLHANDS